MEDGNAALLHPQSSIRHPRRKLVGCLVIAPSSRRLRAGTSLSKVATRKVAIRKDRDTKAELNRRSQICKVLTGTGVRVAKMDGHEGSAPSTPVWKTGMCLSTPMPEEMESRAGIAPASAALQAAA